MADPDDALDFVIYGTPIEREEDTSVRKRKAIADAGQLRTLPPWKQEVRDEEGRQRFHGAFTGGFSAGFFNTVGSKEGWAPQTFTSSRKNRAEVKQQSVYNFLDEDDIKDMGGHGLETSGQYDTFGFTAAEIARKEAQKEQEKRPSAIPGPIPDEVLLPAMHSIGVKLLSRMGWRQGRSIKDAHGISSNEMQREGRKAFIALSSNKDEEMGNDGSVGPESDEFLEALGDKQASGATPIYVLQPKQDMYGLGYDPFKQAPEFRDRKGSYTIKGRDQGTNKSKLTVRGSLLSSNSGKYAPGFGIGALEELDVEDEDIYASGFDYEKMEVDDEPFKLSGDDKLKPEEQKRGNLRFKVASFSDYKVERFPPPAIPDNFEPYHKFTSAVKTNDDFTASAPPEVPPPDDGNLRLLIEGSAALIARCGKSIEDFYKEKSKTNQLFLFLSGGLGSDYYVRKLWEHKQKYGIQQKSDEKKAKSSDEKLTAENRGKLLGERPLVRSNNSRPTESARELLHPRTNHGDSSDKPFPIDDIPDSEKPFKDDPAKQARFEQFIKEKYLGGLRSVQSAAIMSEAHRARERLDFEAAAEAIEKGKWTKGTISMSTQLLGNLPGIGEQRFVSSTHIEMHEPVVEEKSFYPKREYFEWRPSPMLCKRFDLIDPYMGKPMPVQKPKSRIDELIFTTAVKTSGDEDLKESSKNLELASGAQDNKSMGTSRELDFELGTTTVERPVDLYKAIFSDDSDDDDATDTTADIDPAKTSEGANMTLNRLVAGDFLESLGKELGLEIPPPEAPVPALKVDRGPLPGTNSIEGAYHLTRQASADEQGVITTPLVPTEEAHTQSLDMEGYKGHDYPSTYQELKAAKEIGHRSRSPDCTTSGDDYRSRKRSSRSRHSRSSRAADSDSSTDRDQSSMRKQRRRHRRSRTPDSDENGGHRYYPDSGYDKKVSSESKEHVQHRKHRTGSSSNRYNTNDKHSSNRQKDRKSRD